MDELILPNIFADGMVLQQNTKNEIYGNSSPFSKVILTINDIEYSTTSSCRGNWSIYIKPQNPGGPYTMQIVCKQQKIEIKDIYFGDVWLCSGQSNMELTIIRLLNKYPELLQVNDCKEICQYKIPVDYEFETEKTNVPKGKWTYVNKSTITDFSGTAYFFANALYEHNHIPVAVLNASHGGSPVKSWMDKKTVFKYAQYKKELSPLLKKGKAHRLDHDALQEREDWYKLVEKSDLGYTEKNKEWYREDFDDSNWQSFTIPGKFDSLTKCNENQSTTEIFSGIVWFRTTVEINDLSSDEEFQLWMGTIVDADRIYVNGTKVGEIEYRYPPRKYHIPQNLLRKGKNTIAIRVLVTGNETGGEFIEGKKYALFSDKQTISLEGSWLAKISAYLPKQPPQLFLTWKPTALYNTMIAPLRRTALKGIIWYQGESDTGDPIGYSDKFVAMIKAWRKKLRFADSNGKKPFIFVQLPNFGNVQFSVEHPSFNGNTGWPELRNAQYKCSLESKSGLKDTAMAVTIDVGEWNDLHPENKKTIGDRLAAEAEYIFDDEKKTIHGIKPIKATYHKNVILIEFDNGNSPLSVKEGSKEEISGFYVQFKSEKDEYEPKNARIFDGKRVEIRLSEEERPIRIRYAWADNPGGLTLCNQAGYPCGTFELEIS